MSGQLVIHNLLNSVKNNYHPRKGWVDPHYSLDIHPMPVLMGTTLVHEFPILIATCFSLVAKWTFLRPKHYLSKTILIASGLIRVYGNNVCEVRSWLGITVVYSMRGFQFFCFLSGVDEAAEWLLLHNPQALQPAGPSTRELTDADDPVEALMPLFWHFRRNYFMV